MEQQQQRWRPGLRAVLGLVTLLAAATTLVWPDWIEGVFHVDPDHGNGSLEAAIVVALGLVSIAFLASAWTGWRRAHRA